MGVVRGQQLGKEIVQAVMRETLGASVSDAWSTTLVLKLQVREVPVSELFDGDKINRAQMQEVKEVGVEKLKEIVIHIAASDNPHPASAIHGF